jgi:ferredoxin
VIRRKVRRSSRSEAGPIFLQDPIISLTIITVALWVAVIGWKLRRKEQAYGVNRTAAPGPRPAYAPGPRPAYGPRRIPAAPPWDDAGPEWDDDATHRDDDVTGWDDDATRRDDDVTGWDDDPARWGDDSPGRDGPPYEAGRPGRRAPGAPQGQYAEVGINPGKCMRFAFCEHEAPAVFKLVGDRIDYKPSVPPDQVDAVAMAVKVCPARAIKMKMPGSKPYLPQPPVDDGERRPVRR